MNQEREPTDTERLDWLDKYLRNIAETRGDNVLGFGDAVYDLMHVDPTDEEWADWVPLREAIDSQLRWEARQPPSEVQHGT